MKKIIVPKDLRKKAAIGVLWRLIKLAIALAVTFVFIDMVYHSLSETDVGNVSGTIFVVIIIPFIICGVPMKLIERDWYGEIIGFETKNNEKQTFDKRDNIDGYELHALVREPNGILHTCRIYDDGHNHYDQEKVYRVGEKVVHVYGMKYLMPVRENSEQSTACVYCGFKAPVGTKVCGECGCSMDIRIEDIAKRKK